MKKDFDYKIIKHLGTICKSENSVYTLEVNLISYNEGTPKLDIRRWNRANDSMCKGIALSDEESENLFNILQELYKNRL